LPEYRDDNYQIPRNASVIVKRTPMRDERRAAARYLVGAALTRRGVHLASADTLATSAHQGSATFSSTAPLPAGDASFGQTSHAAPSGPVATIEGETEEDKIKSLFQQSDEQWQKQSQQLAMCVSWRINLCLMMMFRLCVL
jgi:hypothetical protein